MCALQVYSYVVLVIEVMGIINMLFYGCWLFAKPNNSDVHTSDGEVRTHRPSASRAPFPHLAPVSLWILDPSHGLPAQQRCMTHLVGNSAREQGMDTQRHRQRRA